MNEMTGMIDIKEYGKGKAKLAEILDGRKITRNKLRTMTDVKYEATNRYCKAENIAFVDLDFIPKVCFVLNMYIKIS